MELEGSVAPPMANGELVFDSPWEGRVFGIATRLSESGVFSWDEFRDCLLDEIGHWERAHAGEKDYRYYDRFLAARMAVLRSKGLPMDSAVEALAGELVTRPHGHDHHDHDERRALHD